MKYFYVLLLIVLMFSFVKAQNVAPNFTLVDIDGTSHTLYDYLDDDKTVILDFYAVWCAPCKANAAGVEEVWESLGPDGTNEIMILGLEGDDNSSDEEVVQYSIDYNCNNPQINATEDVMDLYGVDFYPSYFVVCPDRSYVQYSGDPNTIETVLKLGVELCAPPSNFTDDARIFSYNSGTTICSEETTPNITLMNMGTANLTTVDIIVYLNGDLQSTTSWNGKLERYEFDFITLPTVNLVNVSTPEIRILLEYPNGTDDPNPDNNSITIQVEYGGEIYETTSIHFELAFDNFPQETSWDIVNSVGEIVHSGSGYFGFPDFSPPIDTTFNLPTDCYTFNIYDIANDGICCSFADEGEGFWKISTVSDELIVEGGVFTDIESALFGINAVVHVKDLTTKENEIKVYPNPVKEQLTIENSNPNYSWEIFGVDGRTVLRGVSAGSSKTIINLEQIRTEGIYILKVDSQNTITYKKLFVK